MYLNVDSVSSPLAATGFKSLRLLTSLTLTAMLIWRLELLYNDGACEM